MKDDIRESEEHRAIWFGDRLDNPAKIPCLVELSVKAFFNNNSQILDHYADDLQVDLECDPCKLALIVGFEHSHRSLVAYTDEVMGAEISQWYAEAFMITATCSMRSSRTDISPKPGSRSCSPRFTRHATALRSDGQCLSLTVRFALLVRPKRLNKQWVEARKNGIGGSDVASIMGINKYSSPLSVWLIKTGREPSPDLSGNQAAEWGNRLEDVVADKFAEEHPELKV